MSAFPETRSYTINGIRLQVSCSAAMAAVLDARFRSVPAEEPRAEEIICDFQAVADADRHAVRRPPGNGRPFYEMPKGEAIYFEGTGATYLSYTDGVRALYEPDLNRVSFSVVESEPRNLFRASHLVLTILLVEIFKRHGWYGLHAGGFSENGRAVLIPGDSGSGKSTLTVALLRGGFDYLSDDMVFLARRPDGLVARGIVEDVDVSDQTIRFFPELDFLLQSPKIAGFTKRQVRFEQVYGTRIVPESRPQAIVLPHISGGYTSSIEPIGSDQALLEIVPNVLLTHAPACQAHLDVLADLVSQVPCFRLDTGRDFARIPSLFRGVLSPEPEKACA